MELALHLNVSSILIVLKVNIVVAEIASLDALVGITVLRVLQFVVMGLASDVLLLAIALLIIIVSEMLVHARFR
jgi:hypothetical protein